MTRVAKMIVGTVLLVAICSWPHKSILCGQRMTQVRSTDQSANAEISETNFAIIAQQIRDLKNPTFRALLRIRIVSWVSGDGNQRQAALDVIAEGFSDLCTNQDEVWPPTAGFLRGSLVRAALRLDRSGAGEIIARCSLKKDESVPEAARDLASAMNMLNDPATAAAGIEKGKAAILTGQVPASIIMGHLLPLQNSNRSSLPDLLSATVQTEQQHPGLIPLYLMPFFTPMFIAKSNPTELKTEFFLAVLRATRLRPEEFANPIVKSQVVQALRVIAEPTKLLAPALYQEVATTLNSLAPATANADAQRHAVEERIRASSDQLAQIESEADKTTDKIDRSGLLSRAAQMALTLKKLRKAVDLTMAARAEQGTATYSDRFLGEITLAAINQKEPEAAVYAISKIEKALNKTNGWLLLSKYYADIKEMEKGAAALSDSAKLLKQAANGNDKLELAIAIARASLAYERSASYEAFQQVVETINRLPPPEKEKDKMFYVSLMPIAEELIKSFRQLGAQDNAGALALAHEIKLPELRVAALSGAHSRERTIAPQ